jgi:tetratricopeptide (TPR) repeat protein
VRAGLALLALICYANSFGLGLALDALALLRDPRLHAATAENLGRIFKYDYWWPSSVDQLYRPVTTASLLFNYAVLGNGDQAAGYHVINVLLHVLNVWLVYELALKVLRQVEPAVAAAAIWAVHPIATEVVANVAGRADLLSSACVLGGLLLYVRISESGGRLAVLTIGLFAVALAGVFSKENAAVLVGLMVLWDVAFARRPRMAGYAAVGAALLVMGVARWQIFQSAPWPEMPFVDNPLHAADFWTARLTALKVIGMELRLLVFPLGLSYDHSYHQIPVGAGWIATILVFGVLIAAVARYRQDRVMFWAAGFFGIALLPSSNLIVIIGSIMAERFLYLPSVGFAIAAAALAYRVPRPRMMRAILACVVLILGVCTFARNRAWDSNLTLSSADVHSAPESFRVHQMLADSLFQADPRGNLDAAIREEEIAWSILAGLRPDQILQQVPANLGLYYRLKGDGAGLAWYEKSLAVLLRAREASRAIERNYDAAQLAHGKPLVARVAYRALYLNLGTTYLRLGRPAEAIEAYRYGRELDPSVPEMYDALSGAYGAAGNLEWAAIAMDEKALVFGIPEPTMAALKKLYGADSCAVQGDRLNLSCPRLLSDMCQAWKDLDGVFQAARLPEQARSFQDAAAQNGCSAR